jgi:hypothetical protein
MPGGEQFSRKNETAIAALLGCPTIEMAAATVGVSERTLRNWLKDPRFQQAFRAARHQVVDLALARLQEAYGLAVTSLRDLLTARSEAVRLGACRAILELGVKLRENLDLEQRIAELEEQARRERGQG